MKNILSRFVYRVSTAMLVVLMAICGSGSSYVFASSTSNFTQTINAGTLSVDIVNGSYVTVGSPAVPFSAVSSPLVCLTGGSASTGTLGTASQQIYIQNPDAADNGWVVSLAASATTDTWASAGPDFDFNDAGGSGCTDGADTDSFGGQMTVNPSAGTIGEGQYSEADTGVSLGSSSSFVEGTTDSITIISATAGSVDVGDWTVQGVSLSQTIPAGQAAASDYNINMVLSILAS